MRQLLAAVLLLALLPCSASGAGLVPLPPQPDGVPWPTAAWPEGKPAPEVDADALAAAGAAAFRALGRAGVPNTRALLVVHRGRLVFERYAPGFDRTTRFHSWSMAKSVTQALVGILVGEGRLSLDAPAPVPAWQSPGDPRRALSLSQLLHMTSGLDNADMQGGPGARSLVARMVFGRQAVDQVGLAASAPQVHEPDSRWAYSTATSTIVASIVQATVGGSADDVLAFMRQSLFEPLGMTSVVAEFDAAGSYLGGGFVWATARDWARLGVLFLRDGVWDGRRILPPGWVDYSRTPGPAPNSGAYAAHWWRNLPPTPGQEGLLARGPESAFAANGAYGQYVLGVPTHDLVIVRLGEMQGQTWIEMRAPLSDVIEAFPPLDAESAP